jgi:ABC-2 type transporter.
MNVRRTKAIIIKQVKDTLKNKSVLIQFIMFPLLTFIMVNSIHSSQIPGNYFVLLFATMFVGMAPLTVTASIIAEEKEDNTLRVLFMSNVKPVEYLFGVGFYIFIACSLGAVVFGIVGGFQGMELVRFILTLMLGILTSMMIGAAIGILSKNQMSATSIIVPTMMLFSFLPMISMFNKSVEFFSKIVFTQQINYLIHNLSASNYTWDKFFVIGLNMLIFLTLFLFAYKRKGLAES